MTLRSAIALSALGLAGQAHAATFVATSVDDETDATPGDGLCLSSTGRCSLRAAVQEANALGGANSITLAPGVFYGLSLAGAGEDAAATGDLDVTGELVITGNGATIGAGALDRAFDVGANGDLTIDGLTIGNGSVALESGGALRVTGGTLHVLDSVVGTSEATGTGASGGGIMNAGGTLEVTNSRVSYNYADRAGGGIEANGGTTTITDSALRANRTGALPGNGGGLHLTGAGTVSVLRATVTDNVAASEGGGLWNSGTGIMDIADSDILRNRANGTAADNGGGGLFNDGGTMTVSGSLIHQNRALRGSGSGGGILNFLGTLRVTDTDITQNQSRRAGGGIEANVGSTTIVGGNVLANSTGAAPGNGGGLHLTGAGTVDIDGTLFRANFASAEGGGIWNSSTGTMTVANAELRGNTASGAGADQGGGGAFNDGDGVLGGVLTLTNTVISGNAANGTAGSGGGILNDQGSLVVSGAYISENYAVRAGGGVEANEGTTEIYDSTVSRNSANPGPGNGGAIHLTGLGTVLVDGGEFRSNDASNQGGAFWNSSTGTFTVTNSVAIGNTAPIRPIAYTAGGTMTVNGTPVLPIP